MKRALTLSLVGLLLAASFTGCATRRGTGTAVGAAAGAAVGGLIGNQSGNTAVGAILGAAVGGAAGAWIGNYMDKQAAEIEQDLEGATVTRVGEGIKITFDSGILFDVNKAALKPASKTNLENLAEILQKYDDTRILIEGHTDSTGDEDHNLGLSERRAKSVSAYLGTLAVDPGRFEIMGYGELQPIADNDTAAGRAQNRRVELAIMANDDLKDRAREMAE